MNRFIKWLRNNSTSALIVLLLLLVMIPIGVTLGKYVATLNVATLDLNITAISSTGEAYLVRSTDFNNAFGSNKASVKNIVFGNKKAYISQIGSTEGTVVSTNESPVEVRLYISGDTAYVLAEKPVLTIHANPDCSNMFIDLTAATSIEFNNLLDTSNATNMAYMFSGCKGLTSLDVSSFDTRNVTTMEAMFKECESLPLLDVRNFDTSNVTNMAYMFSGCKGLTSLDVSSFDTRNVTTMESMFRECESLHSLDVSSFNTSNVTTMYIVQHM